jgi:acetyl esterase/lipase
MNVGSFSLTFKVRSTMDTGGHRDCCIFWGYQDAEHFYYAHLGAKPDPASGQIMIVNGEPRKPLTENKKEVPWDDQWHTVRVTRDLESGKVDVFFDNLDTPHMSVVDKTFGAGRIGIGSFDDMNEFDGIELLAAKTTEAKQEKPQNEKPRNAAKTPPARPTPTVADYVYGTESARQRIDFWQAKSDLPTPVVVLIHGGGWVNGDKTGYGNNVIRTYLDAGISVAAINYRFIAEAMEQKVEPPVKGCLHDAARAIQTIRAKAKEWNIDPQRIGASGSSAGACTSIWLASHDDLADPNSQDPIARQSSRLMAVAVSGAQTSLDPLELREWMSNAVYGGHAFGFAAKGRSRPQEFDLLLANRDQVKHWFADYSPIELISQDDGKFFLEYPNQKTEPVLGGKEPDPTHSAIYGIKFLERCQEKGVNCELVYPGYTNSKFKNVSEFLIHHLKSPLDTVTQLP